jgi:hypothetical protein
MQYVGKVFKALYGDLLQGLVRPIPLIRACYQLVLATPVVEFEQRRTDKVPLAMQPLRVIKDILRVLVKSIGYKALAECGVAIVGAENSVVYQWLEEYIRLEEEGDEDDADHKAMVAGTFSQRLIKAPAEDAEEEEEEEEEEAFQQASSQDIHDELVNLVARLYFVEQREAAIADLYEFMMIYPEMMDKLEWKLAPATPEMQILVRKGLQAEGQRRLKEHAELQQRLQQDTEPSPPPREAIPHRTIERREKRPGGDLPDDAWTEPFQRSRSEPPNGHHSEDGIVPG